jgi:adenosylcobinamide amidohydrolase
MIASPWEEITMRPEFRLRRSGRFLIAELTAPHLVLSTSVRNGGQQEKLQYLVNHQSCEASDHHERHRLVAEIGQERYHDQVCEEIGLDPAVVAMMGTAANMNYASVIESHDEELRVVAVVTAGVQGNAACAGDPASWREAGNGWERIAASEGTINTMLLISHPVTAGALARAVVTMTEAKSAALQRLAVGSLYSQDAATGTGTDQYCLAAVCGEAQPLTSTSPHVKLGELIGVAVRDATLEALRWQNGLEPSYTRGIFHALGRYGFKEADFFEAMAAKVTGRELELLRRNHKAVFYEPLVSASAYAIASVLDRLRYGTLPAGAAKEALRQQAASLAANVAAKPHLWEQFHSTFREADLEHPAESIREAIAAGWSAKWT